MTERIGLLVLSGAGILLALATAPGIAGAQDDCDRYVAARATLDPLVARRQEADRRMDASALGSAERQRLGQERRALFEQVRPLALEAARLLKACAAIRPVDAASDDALKRAYQTAQHFLDGQQCGEAMPLLAQCGQHPRAATLTVGGYGISKAVAASQRRCVAVATGHSEFSYSGKIAYIIQTRKDWLIDERPYSSDELAAIGAKLFTTAEVAQAEAVLGPLSPRGAVLVRPPFVLVAGPGELPRQAYEARKYPPGDPGAGPTGDSAEQALQEVFARIVAPVADKLGRELFTGAERRVLIPVYLVGGRLDEAGLRDFAGYCQTVHRRSCGVRLGYYLPYDNSVMVWLSSGGGTLAHELVHALMEEHFPAAPSWLSEGLASLHEAFGPGVAPLDNYRLYYVRAAMSRFGRLIPVDRLVAMTPTDFDAGDAAPLNAAFTRYFVFYLADRGKFASVYQKIREAADRSPAAQLRVLEGELGMPARAIQADWQLWVARRAEPVDWQAFKFEIADAVAQLNRPAWSPR